MTPNLERNLLELGAAITYPPTPDLAGAVTARLRAPAAGDRPVIRFTLQSWRGLAIAALILLAVLGGGFVLVVSGAGAAIADRLGVPGIGVQHVPERSLPTPDPGQPVTRENMKLGRAVPLPELLGSLPFTLLLPSLPAFAQPDESYMADTPPGGHAMLLYRARPGLPALPGTDIGLLLGEFQGRSQPEYFRKVVGPNTRLEMVTVGRVQGLWIEGAPHAIYYLDAQGQMRDEAVRLAGNVLLWQAGSVTVRLETGLSRDEAVRIAASVTPNIPQ